MEEVLDSLPMESGERIYNMLYSLKTCQGRAENRVDMQMSRALRDESCQKNFKDTPVLPCKAARVKGIGP